jgi:Zn-dependent peptidase ImmA (M78 family)
MTSILKMLAVAGTSVDLPQTQEEVQPKSSKPLSEDLSLEALVEACRRKRISFEETDQFTVLEGAVVTCGSTSIISVRASLPEPDKRFALAHELAHIALGHGQSAVARYLWGKSTVPAAFQHDRQQEHDANVWAAHLLVQPEVFERNLRVAGSSIWSGRRAVARAVKLTAKHSKVPEHVVRLWLDNRHVTFPEVPTTWLERS